MKKFRILLLISVFTLIFTSCGKENVDTPKPVETEPKIEDKVVDKVEEKPESVEEKSEIKFIADDSLDKYLNLEKVTKELKEMPFGATSPVMGYADDNYAVITTHKGILIYDINNEKLLNAITSETKLSRTMGDSATVTLGNGELILGFNEGFGTIPNEDFYIFSTKENKLMLGKEEYLEYFNTALVTDEFNNMINTVIEVSDTQEINAIKTKDNLIVFRSDYNDVSEWSLYVLDLKQDGYKEMQIFE